jgi:nuclease S1
VVRVTYKSSAPWHFIDLGVKAGAGNQAQWNSNETAYAKLVAYHPAYMAGAPDELEDGSDLKFIAHLIGDIHQPLHTATDLDRGGNCLFAN